MTTRKRTSTGTPAPKVEAVKPVEVTDAPEVVVEETAPVVTAALEPKVEELKNEDTTVNTLKDAQSPLSIQDQIRDKLNHTKEEASDLFNPTISQAATKAKMESIATEQGFQLTRGREIGARLLARAKANRS
jgi:hypothetical protein